MSSTRNSLASRANYRKSLFSNNRINVVIEDFEDHKEANHNEAENRETGGIATFLFNPSPLHSEMLLGGAKGVSPREEGANKEASGIRFDSLASKKSGSLTSSPSSSDSDSRDSSSENDSLDESEYSSKNPFVTQYSQLVHKFEKFELHVTLAQMRLKSGQLETLTREQLGELLFNFKGFSG